METRFSEQRAGSMYLERQVVKPGSHRRTATAGGFARKGIREHRKNALKLIILKIYADVQNGHDRAYWRHRAMEYEAFVARMLDNMQERGVVAWHIWQEVYPDGAFIDTEIGADHIGLLTKSYGGVPFLINTKSTLDALRKHEEKSRSTYVLGYYPLCDLYYHAEEDMRREEERLLVNILNFFGNT